jgi:hypothetical protein
MFGEFGMLVERTPEAVGAHPECLPGHLADRLQRSAVGSEEQRDPDDAFVSDCGDLDPFAALQADDERDHARERKPRVGDGSVRLIEYLPDGQGDLLHPGQEPDLQVARDRRENAILSGRTKLRDWSMRASLTPLYASDRKCSTSA